MVRKIKKTKLFNLLVERELCADGTAAKALIMAGKVIVDDQRVDKPGTEVGADAVIRLRSKQDDYVSRGAYKLAGALQATSLDRVVAGAIALDIGASTGGFTHCLLHHGARKVYALDVGTNQLAWKLRNDPRVQVMEKTDIRRVPAVIDDEISLVVADISFNSLARLLPSILAATPSEGVNYLLLVKPQFELSVQEVPEGGVVDDDSLRQKATDGVRTALREHGIHEVATIDSQLPGRMGNREVFVCFQR